MGVRVKREEKWRQDGVSAPGGAGEEERLPHPEGPSHSKGQQGGRDSGGVVGIRAEHGKWFCLTATPNPNPRLLRL